MAASGTLGESEERLSTVLEEGDWTFENPSERARIEAGLGIRDEWKDRFPVEVSGGELQRFCIARALGRRTELLIADEMTTMLDLITQGQIWDFVLRTKMWGDGDDCGEPFAGASGEGV